MALESAHARGVADSESLLQEGKMHNFQKLAGVARGAAALLAFGAGPATTTSGSVNANPNPIEGSEVDGIALGGGALSAATGTGVLLARRARVQA